MRYWKRSLFAAGLMLVATACGSDNDESSPASSPAPAPAPETSATETSATETSATETSATETSATGASEDGFARAQAEVEKFTANPAFEISPLPDRPSESIYAIQVNCSIPACAPGAMEPAMNALGWKFEEMAYDISKGPAAAQQALTQAIAADPDFILIGVNFPESTFQAQVDAAAAQGIKFVNIGGNGIEPGYIACIQCAASLAELGALGANIALADAGNKTEIAVAYDKAIVPLVTELEGAKKEVAENGEGSQTLELELSVSATPADNAATMISFLQRNPNVEYVIITNAGFLPLNTLQSVGLDSRVKLVVLYPLSEGDVAAVKDGHVLAYAAGELGALYWRAADAAARASMGIEVDPIEPIQSLRVMDQSNADISLLDPPDYQNVFETAWNL